MARLSRADQVLIEQAEDLIRRIQQRAGVNRSIQQVLESDPILLGEATMIARLFIELDHIKVEDPLLVEFIHSRS